ncbi:Hydrogenase expression protein HypA [Pseudomonas syringae pv. aptata]|uniref:Hydrogenase expression protein HypA n=1 Tax=Pseudomonas syringae pv. aptata TaxID=83167 RepID=A0A3M3X2Q8_PSEAP|nr:Hydrogenase expression protein HypA [Pseudomonas syringae pv. aptata]
MLPGQGLLHALIEQLTVRRDEIRQVSRQQAHGTYRRRDQHLLQPAACQLEEHRRIALGAQQPDWYDSLRHDGFRPWHMLEVQGKSLHTAVASGQEQDQIGDQPLERKQQGLMGLDIEIQLDAYIEKVRRRVALQRHGALAEQGVEVLQHAGRKPPCQRIAGQRQHLPHTTQPHACQGGSGFAAQPDAFQWHLLQTATQFMRTVDAQPVMHVGQHSRGYRVGRDHDAMAKTLRGQLFTQTRLEHRPGAEQLEAGFDFHQQHPRVLEADIGTETVGPGREQLLQMLDIGRVMLDRGEVRHQRLCCGQRLPGFQTQRTRSRIDALQHATLSAAADQRQRFIGVAVTTHDAVQRQLRQQDTGPKHKNLKRRSGTEWGKAAQVRLGI